MVEGLLTRKEYDSMYTREVDTWTKQWDQYKSEILDQIKRERAIKKTFA